MAKRLRGLTIVPELALWLKNVAVTASADLTAHEAAADPHAGYALDTDLNLQRRQDEDLLLFLVD